VARVA
jgi:2-polyprenyl-6-methoxyphenol hydroxylase-like FAD-dependent oxidoreductase